MKIKKIEINNFKSIKHIIIDCNDRMNAFIGKNGTGKSAVFDAINVVLGEMYPTANTFPKDYFNDDKEEIIIKIEFDKMYHCIMGLTFTAKYKDGKLETSINPKLTTEIRDYHRINYIGSDRSVKSIMPTNGWSLLGRQFYSSDFFSQEIKEKFNKCMEQAKSELEKSEGFKNFMSSIQAKLSNQINRPDIKSDFTMYDTKHFLKTLEFYVEKNGKLINLVNEGSGIQNSFILATLQTLSEQDFRKINKKPNNPIFIDEPELYLHPHAKKSLYNTLEKLAESGTQIFYITHSAEFLSYRKSQEIHRFYIDGENGTQSKKGLLKPEINEVTDDKSQNSINFNNAFFADIVFLVEGYTDYLFLEEVIKNKTNKKSIEELNISILSVDGKKLFKTKQDEFANVEKFYNMYSNLGIKCFVIYDKDIEKNKSKENKSKENKKINDKIEELGNVYGFDEDLETFLGYKVKTETDETESNAKIRLIKEWLKNPNQEKIETIWKAIIEKIPTLNQREEEIPF